MPEYVTGIGCYLERLVGVPGFVLVAIAVLVVMTVRYWPRPGAGLEVLVGRAMLSLLAVVGIGLSLRYVALLLQGDLARANERLSDLERGGMLVALAFATGTAGVHALRSAFAPEPVPAPPPVIPALATDVDHENVGRDRPAG